MTNFSTNQVMQFYVHEEGHKLVVDKKFADGSFSMAITKDGAVPTSDGKTTNAIGRTDKIENVMWAKLTKAAKLVKKCKSVTLTIEGDVVPGEDYVVRVSYPEVGGLGVEGWTTKTAVYTAKKGDAPAVIYTELAKAFRAAFEADGVLTVDDTDGLSFTQTTLYVDNYERGIRPVSIVDFNVSASPIVEDGVERNAFTGMAVDDGTGIEISGSYKLADMEYFAMGERGDEYRMMGYPDYIKTNYLIDVKKPYDVLVIHYAYKGANDQSHKSEKDMIIALPNGATIAGLTAALTTLGVTVETVDVSKA